MVEEQYKILRAVVHEENAVGLGLHRDRVQAGEDQQVAGEMHDQESDDALA